jgi:hypothetical protein
MCRARLLVAIYSQSANSPAGCQDCHEEAFTGCQDGHKKRTVIKFRADYQRNSRPLIYIILVFSLKL